MKLARVVWVILLFCIAAAAAPQPEWRVPAVIKKLNNGLTVVVSEDHSAPIFGVNVAYGIGFRLEPQGRSGFAHLFEHMMFEGTPVTHKGIFDQVVEGGGGWNNGDTRYDFTEYMETAPTSALDAILWLEADRMRMLDFSPENLENQRSVVKEEVRVNVLNQPYALFFAIDLPGKAFDKYPNAHNFYGDFTDLNAANIHDVKSFWEHYYVPDNAVITVAGDVNADEVFAKVEKYFGNIPSRPVPAKPDLTEAPQTVERRATQTDEHARTPGLAIGYRMPPRQSRDAVVAAVVGELLHNGQASILYQSLVKDKKVANDVSGGVNWPLGNPFEYAGPTLMTTLVFYPNNVSEDQLLSAYDAAIAELATKGPSAADLERIRTKMRSDWYGQLEVPVDRAGMLSRTVLLDGNADRINDIPMQLASVTPADVKAFAAKYLVKTNRTVLNRVPKAGEAKGGN
jgi:zinc protease